MFAYLLFEIASWVIGLVALTLLFLHLAKHTAISTLIKRQGIYIPATILIFTLFVGLIANRTYPPDFAMPAFMRSHAPGGVSAALPFGKIVQFFLNKDNFEKVSGIHLNDEGLGRGYSWYVHSATGKIVDVHRASRFEDFPSLSILDGNSKEAERYIGGIYFTSC